MKLEDLKVINDEDLERLKTAVEDEQQERAERRKRDAIAKIKEVAGAVGLSVHIEGQRGRPTKLKPTNDNRPFKSFDEPEKVAKNGKSS